MRIRSPCSTSTGRAPCMGATQPTSCDAPRCSDDCITGAPRRTRGELLSRGTLKSPSSVRSWMFPQLQKATAPPLSEASWAASNMASFRDMPETRSSRRLSRITTSMGSRMSPRICCWLLSCSICVWRSAVRSTRRIASVMSTTSPATPPKWSSWRTWRATCAGSVLLRGTTSSTISPDIEDLHLQFASTDVLAAKVLEVVA